MSEMSSFYGGRQGNSIIIAKRFDGIDIPQNEGAYNYTCGLYAVDRDNNFIITQDKNIEGAVGVGISDGKGNYTYSTTDFLIKRTKKNNSGSSISNFNKWVKHNNNASQINDTSYVFYPELSEGMVQFFQKGAETSSEVGYGEYVIIDTIKNMNSYNDVDNGKIFRRGFDINSTDGLAGAEYIGQIVGPQGDTPELNFKSYKEIVSSGGYSKDQYSVSNESVIPGSYIKDGNREFTDAIQYVWTNIQDDNGNSIGCNIGFKFPALVQEFTVDIVSPYTEYTPITPDEEYYNEETGEWSHPFYHKWNLSIPSGPRGISSEEIELIPSSTKKVESKGSSINIYDDVDCNILSGKIEEEGTTYSVIGTSYKYINSISDLDEDDLSARENFELIKGKNYIRYGSEYDISPSVVSCKINIDGVEKYVKKEDCCNYILRYRETNYENETSGERRYYYIGEYNEIKKITLSEDGILTAFYSGGEQVEQLEQVLRWIDTENTDGITFDEDGSVHIYYNTMITGEDGQQVHEHRDFPKLIDWVKEVTLTENGQFTVLYNNDTVTIGQDSSGNPIKSDTYSTTLRWIQNVEFQDDGTVIFRWNNGQVAYVYSKAIKYINNIQVQTEDSSEEEGSGDQKIHITYNTGDTAIVGKPLNYIIEACINDNYHLLVYYADPALRATFESKHASHYSTKLNKVLNDWVDLGNVRGEPGGIHIIKDVSSLDELKNDDGSYLKPEEVGGSEEFAGWACTVTGEDGDSELVCYDYDKKIWYSIGSIGSSAMKPEYTIVKSRAQEGNLPATSDVEDLKNNGIWLATSSATFAS